MQVKLVLWLEDVTNDVIKDAGNVTKQSPEEQGDAAKYVTENVIKDVIKNSDNVIKDVIKELTERQKIIVKILIGEPACTVEDLAGRLGVTWRTIMRDIEKLKKLNVVTREGGRAEGRWIVKLDKE